MAPTLLWIDGADRGPDTGTATRSANAVSRSSEGSWTTWQTITNEAALSPPGRTGHRHALYRLPKAFSKLAARRRMHHVRARALAANTAIAALATARRAKSNSTLLSPPSGLI